MNAAPTPPYLQSMVECHKKMMSDGFTEDFTAEEGILKCVKTGKTYKPEEVTILNFFRFEGESDPGDNSIMYVVETSDGTKGTIIDGYGPDSDPDLGPFITEVEKIQKKMPTK